MNEFVNFENENPQSLIGGSVEPTHVSHLDFLSFTLPNLLRSSDDIPYASDFAEAFRFIGPRKGYSRAIQFDGGARMDWAPDRPMQGVGCVYGGEVLKKLRRTGGSEGELINDLLGQGAKFTRIDAAVNTAIPDAHPFLCKDHFDDGKCKTGAKSFTTVQKGGEGRGATFYLGSRTSERMLRVYDKAAQSKLMGISWTRIELEMKGRHAQHFAKSFPSDRPDYIIKSAIRSFADFPELEWWVETMGDADEFERLVLPRTETNTERWLTMQVLPALKRLTIEDNEALLRFLRAAAHDRGLLYRMEFVVAQRIADLATERSQGQIERRRDW